MSHTYTTTRDDLVTNGTGCACGAAGPRWATAGRVLLADRAPWATTGELAGATARAAAGKQWPRRPGADVQPGWEPRATSPESTRDQPLESNCDGPWSRTATGPGADPRPARQHGVAGIPRSWALGGLTCHQLAGAASPAFAAVVVSSEFGPTCSASVLVKGASALEPLAPFARNTRIAAARQRSRPLRS